MSMTRRRLIATPLAIGALAAPAIRRARAAEPVIYLTPAPSFLVAFVPHHIAGIRGYFAANNVAVSLRTSRGGADGAKQVAVDNADLAGSVGEISMIVRANGLPVRGVLLLGRRPIFRLAARRAAGISGIADLRGKKIGVLSYQDTAYYSLLGVLAANGVGKSDLQIEAVGNAGLTQLMIAGSLDAIMDTPDWADDIEAAGVPLDIFPVDRYFPAMGAAVFSSDATIRRRPDAIRGVVQALVHAVQDCIADPAAAARDFCAAVPQQAGKAEKVERVLRLYVEQSYRVTPLSGYGRFDAEQLTQIEDFYVANGLVEKRVAVGELYTNEFVG